MKPYIFFVVFCLIQQRFLNSISSSENVLKTFFNIKVNTKLKDSDEYLNVKAIKEHTDKTPKPCLISMIELYNKLGKEKFYSITSSEDYNRLRFYYGNCNPVLLIPGTTASRLEVEIDCEGLKTKDKKLYNKLTNICSTSSICIEEKGKLEKERHVIWPAASSKFSFLKVKSYISIDDKNNCFTFLFQFFNNKESCPRLYDDNNKDVVTCNYSPFIKFMPFGISNPKNEDDFCGFSSVSNLLYIEFIEKYLSQNKSNVVRMTKGYSYLASQLENDGYIKSFSFAALPYDFRENDCENKQFAKSLYDILNYLHTNTQKKVIVITHSYGNNYLYHQLNFSQNKFFLISKIEHIINIGGPVTGTFKADQAFSVGMSEFLYVDNEYVKVGVDLNHQSVLLPFIKSIYSMKKYPYEKILPYNDEEYSELIEAINQRADYEECEKRKESQKENKKDDEKCGNDDKFHNLFPELSILKEGNEVCEMNKNWKKNNVSFINSSKDGIDEIFPNYHPCHIGLNRIFINQCPNVKILNDEKILDNLSNLEKKHLLCSKNKSVSNEEYYNCDTNQIKSMKIKNNQCINSFMNRYILNPDYHVFVDPLLFKSKSEVKTIYKSFSKACPITGDIPDVDTTFIMNKSFDTKFGSLYTIDEDGEISKPTKRNTYFANGDGTVESESIMLPVLKALFNKKKGKFKSKIHIADYCSSVNRKYMKNSNNNSDSIYYFIDCECKNSDGLYNSNLNCSHPVMISDKYIIENIREIISKIKNKNEEKFEINDDKVIERVCNKEYNLMCNKILKDVFYQ